MKEIVLTICFFFLLSEITFGQSHEYKSLNDTELKIINDLSSTLKDKCESYIISPFIVSPIQLYPVLIKELINKYGFNRTQLEKLNSDTLILNKNDYFKIINPDSLTKYSKISRDTTMLISNPLLYSIKKYYEKKGICYFHKIVFSENKDYALVEYWFYCGFLCGQGATVIMKRTANNWIVFEIIARSLS
jgi:hypothetical protein